MRTLAAALIAATIFPYAVFGPASAGSCSDQARNCLGKCADKAAGGNTRKCERKCELRTEQCLQTGVWTRGNGAPREGMSRR